MQGVIFTSNANAVLKNAKINNTYTGTDVAAVGIFVSGDDRIPSFNNLKVSINLSHLTNNSVFYPGGGNIRNYGLFVNKAIDEDEMSSNRIILLIGTGLNPSSPETYNYQYIVDTEI